MPYALQCNHDGDHMAHGCNARCEAVEKQLDIVNALPKDYVFLNYLRCHDDIGWGLDYATLQMDGMEERAHKKYLNDYFQGYDGGSNSRGELYNAPRHWRCAVLRDDKVYVRRRESRI